MNQDLVLPAIEDDGFYPTVIAGTYLGFQSTTMRNSRHTGKLAGVNAPAHIKMGSAVRYLGKTLKDWRAQFAERTSTCKAA